MSRSTKLAAVARRVGEAVEDECVWHRWERINRRQAKAVRKRVNETKHARQRRASARGFARRWQPDAIAKPWNNYKTLAIGRRFIDYLVRLGVLELTKIETRGQNKKQKPPHALRLTPLAADWLKDMADFLAVTRPLQWPLVIPPLPWAAAEGGGFHFREIADLACVPRPLKPLPLVRRASAEQRKRLAEADLSAVFAGLNVAQNTAWRINPRVYRVFAQMMADGLGGPGLTHADPAPEPGRLADELAKDNDKLRAHKAEIRMIKSANSKLISQRFGQHRVFATARRFAEYPSIYFAYNLDFRGRVYACSDDLSPQGNDLQRGLLEFSEGDPMTGDGMDWLLIHASNTYGVDKVSFRERINWANRQREMISAVADDPFACIEWHNADKPWQFLAACFAITDQVANPGAPCRVPVMLDGSCSGIQHWSALLHDEETGRAVNLAPGAEPADLYQRVAERVVEILAAGTLPYGREWADWGGINRKIVKRSVMVLPYGGTFISTLEKTREAVRAVLDGTERPRWLTDEAEGEAFVTLAKAVWEGQRERLKGPVAGMEYVRQTIKAWNAAAPERKVSWLSPTGFPVVTDYINPSEKLMVPGTVGGKPANLSYYNEGAGIDWKKLESRTAPNFIHSLDAAHLVMSLQAASDSGITKVAVVHDAFGTTPTRTGEFAELLRQTFARLYESDPLECLTAALREVGGEAPEAPPKGALIVADIAKSEYLFA